MEPITHPALFGASTFRGTQRRSFAADLRRQFDRAFPIASGRMRAFSPASLRILRGWRRLRGDALGLPGFGWRTLLVRLGPDCAANAFDAFSQSFPGWAFCPCESRWNALAALRMASMPCVRRSTFVYDTAGITTGGYLLCVARQNKAVGGDRVPSDRPTGRIDRNRQTDIVDRFFLPLDKPPCATNIGLIIPHNRTDYAWSL